MTDLTWLKDDHRWWGHPDHKWIRARRTKEGDVLWQFARSRAGMDFKATFETLAEALACSVGFIGRDNWDVQGG